MTRFFLLVCTILGAFALSGCSQNLARFTAVSTTMIQLPETNQKGDYVSGKECINYIFGIPLGNHNNRVSGAVAKALENAYKNGQPADALTNAEVAQSYWTTIIFGRDCVTARGQAIGVKGK